MKSTVLITGTSRGIGLELVKQLSKADWVERIFATSRNETDNLKQVISANPQVKFIKLDVKDESSIKSVAAQVAKDLGSESGLNYLINNAAIHSNKKLEETEAAEFNEILQTNITAPTIMMKEFLPLLEKAHKNGEKALVVNYSTAVSSFGITDSAGAYMYRVSKAGLNMLTHTMNIYLEPRGIQVMSLHPGWVLTEMGGPNAQQTPEKSVAQCIGVIREAKPEHIGKLVNYAGVVLPW